MKVEVFIDWDGVTHLAGHLHTAERGTAVTFQYDPSWLAAPGSFALDPTSLPLSAAPLHAPVLFGAFQDCGPDRWGRILVERAVRKNVLPAKPRHDLDYTLALDDGSRIGALRFRTAPDGPFLANAEGPIPPLVRLTSLLHAADAIHGETETAMDLRHLLGQGSPLGGARPKSSMLMPDGRLAIAKFPKPDDERDIAAGEILALELASQAGIRAAEHRLVQVGGRSVSVITRFDRDGNRRIPFLSANTLLGLSPGETGSYVRLAEAIRQFGHDVPEELAELWRRMVFSLLTSNFDDHMRNHGFLMRAPGRWSLSPAYDLNPVPEIDRSRMPKTPVEEESEPSLSSVMAASRSFGLTNTAARRILGDVAAAVGKWRTTGRSLRIPASTLAAYASAFDHEHLREAEVLATRR